MAVGIVEAVGASVAEIAVDPADAAAHLLDDRDAALEAPPRDDARYATWRMPVVFAAVSFSVWNS